MDQSVILMQAVGRHPRNRRVFPGTNETWECDVYCLQYDHVVVCDYDRYDRADDRSADRTGNGCGAASYILDDPRAHGLPPL